MRSRNLKSVCGMQKKNEILWLREETEVSICQLKYSEIKRRNATKVVRRVIYIVKNVERGTKRCIALQAFSLVCNFYLLGTFIAWSIKAQAFKVYQ